MLCRLYIVYLFINYVYFYDQNKNITVTYIIYKILKILQSLNLLAIVSKSV